MFPKTVAITRRISRKIIASKFKITEEIVGWIGDMQAPEKFLNNFRKLFHLFKRLSLNPSPKNRILCATSPLLSSAWHLLSDYSLSETLINRGRKRWKRSA